MTWNPSWQRRRTLRQGDEHQRQGEILQLLRCSPWTWFRLGPGPEVTIRSFQYQKKSFQYQKKSWSSSHPVIHFPWMIWAPPIFRKPTKCLLVELTTITSFDISSINRSELCNLVLRPHLVGCSRPRGPGANIKFFSPTVGWIAPEIPTDSNWEHPKNDSI